MVGLGSSEVIYPPTQVPDHQFLLLFKAAVRKTLSEVQDDDNGGSGQSAYHSVLRNLVGLVGVSLSRNRAAAFRLLVALHHAVRERDEDGDEERELRGLEPLRGGPLPHADLRFVLSTLRKGVLGFGAAEALELSGVIAVREGERLPNQRMATLVWGGAGGMAREMNNDESLLRSLHMDGL